MQINRKKHKLGDHLVHGSNLKINKEYRNREIRKYHNIK